VRGVVLVLAAGSGERLAAGVPKAYVEIGGIPIVRRSAEAACAAELVDGIVVAGPPGHEARVEALLERLGKPVRVVAGGSSRQASAAAALAAAGEAEAVVVHDAARALCRPELFDQCLLELDEVEAVCVAVRVTDTIKDVERDVVHTTLDRARLVAVQTPQAFRTDLYRRAHAAAHTEATDDAALVEAIGARVRVIPGDPANIKVTTPDDLIVAEALLGSRT
jgi:2-C-methyl-D-erythritol 4-phosphate cytidylyltransferase